MRIGQQFSTIDIWFDYWLIMDEITVFTVVSLMVVHFFKNRLQSKYKPLVYLG